MTKTYGLTPEKHEEIERRLKGACELLDITIAEINDAYSIGSEEYQIAYKAYLAMEDFRVSMINAKENEREQREQRGEK